MSDIPDWLVELAAQRDADEEDEEDEFLTDVQASPADEYEEPEPTTFSEATPTTGEPEDDDLMAALRSQVDFEEVEEEPAEKRSFSINLAIPGLQPWQQLVLSVLLFLDILVVGLLFLVILGRVGIP
ncbi:MAG: hypothetical protein ACP5JG_02255 [Anaerolineae bacterium]